MNAGFTYMASQLYIQETLRQRVRSAFIAERFVSVWNTLSEVVDADCLASFIRSLQLSLSYL